MALNYSRFDHIEDSDSDGDPRGMDLATLLGGRQDMDGEDGDEPAESPREALARAQQESAPVGRDAPGVSEEVTETGEAPPPPTFERFVELLGGAEAARHDDAMELVATARATVQSAMWSQEAPAPTQLISALSSSFVAQPRPTEFAKDYSAELLQELLAISVSTWLPPEVVTDSEKVLVQLTQKCRAKEIYTFLIDAIYSDDLAREAQLEGVRFLQVALERMDASKRHMFLGSCFPAVLRKFTERNCPRSLFSRKLEVLRTFAMAFSRPGPSIVDPADPGTVVQAMISAFLFKLLQRSYSQVAPAVALQLTSPGCSMEPGRVPNLKMRHTFELGGAGIPEDELSALVATARDAAAASPQPLLQLIEQMDLGDPTGDGGGDLEVSPLCLAVIVCLLELHGRWRELGPLAILPVGVSAARRAGALMKCCFILASHRAGPEVLSVGGDAGAWGSEGAAPSGVRWSDLGLALFVRSTSSLLEVAAMQCPQAYRSLSGPLCRWYPSKAFQTLLETLSSSPDLSRPARGAIFRTLAAAMRIFAWPCRCGLYLDMISCSRVDSIVGAVVSLFKDDWWPHVLALARAGASIGEERGQLVKLLRLTLAGDMQITDAMDTITGALNVARIVALAGPPAGPFLRAALRKGGPGVDLESLLDNISKQIDAELAMLNAPSPVGGSLAKELEEQLGGALGSPESVAQMKRDRISMVAHLVARVRELLSDAATAGT